MVRKKIKFALINDKSRWRSTRNKRLVGLLKKEMKLHRLTEMPFASFYFVDEQLVQIASSNPNDMVKKVMEHLGSGKSVQTLTPDDLEKLESNELKIGVRRGNRRSYFGDEAKTSQAHMSPEEQRIASQAAANLRLAADGNMHGGLDDAIASGVVPPSHVSPASAAAAEMARHRGISNASSAHSSESSNCDDDGDDMSANDAADPEDRKPIIKPDMDASFNSFVDCMVPSSPSTVPSAVTVAATNFINGLPLRSGMSASSVAVLTMAEEDRKHAMTEEDRKHGMTEEDRKHAAVAQSLLQQTCAAPSSSALPPSSSGNPGINSLNYHAHQYKLLNNAAAGARNSVSGRKRPRDEYSVAISQINDRMTKEGIMIKNDPHPVSQQPRQQIAGVPTVPPLDIAALMRSITPGGGAPLDFSDPGTLSRLLAASVSPPDTKFDTLTRSILNHPSLGVHPPLIGPQPPGACSGSMNSASRFFSSPAFSPQQMQSSMPPGTGGGSPSMHSPPSSSHAMASSFLASDNIFPPSGPPPGAHQSQSTSSSSSQSRAQNYEMMNVLK